MQTTFNNSCSENWGYNDYLIVSGSVFQGKNHSRRTLTKYNGDTYGYGEWNIEPCEDLRYAYIVNYLGEYLYATDDNMLFDSKR